MQKSFLGKLYNLHAIYKIDLWYYLCCCLAVKLVNSINMDSGECAPREGGLVGPDLGCGSPGDAPLYLGRPILPRGSPGCASRHQLCPRCAGLQFSMIHVWLSIWLSSDAIHAPRCEEGLLGDAWGERERSLPWYPEGSVLGDVLICDLDEGSWLVDHPGGWQETGGAGEQVGRQSGAYSLWTGGAMFKSNSRKSNSCL